MDDILDTFRRDVAGSEGRLSEVARGTGIPHGTLWNIAHGNTEFPRYNIVLKLQEFYQKQQAA